ncbi:hypothetical protein C2I27_03810 [Priestia megaterium]|uniref:hypothetical protein n=1 Tax=Priestia megaterium TaxID=1404 RepID=UPI000D52234A|nr:hypothetical protein [Priestia megaterium]PVC75022.1 hypothetical protein C2I27_03810 [Priestia megaterium]
MFAQVQDINQPFQIHIESQFNAGEEGSVQEICTKMYEQEKMLNAYRESLNISKSEITDLKDILTYAKSQLKMIIDTSQKGGTILGEENFASAQTKALYYYIGTVV